MIVLWDILLHCFCFLLTLQCLTFHGLFCPHCGFHSKLEEGI
jgi:hypothetical protein